jgi:hypothetical protein
MICGLGLTNNLWTIHRESILMRERFILPVPGHYRTGISFIQTATESITERCACTTLGHVARKDLPNLIQDIVLSSINANFKGNHYATPIRMV